jgi:predicted esterase
MSAGPVGLQRPALAGQGGVLVWVPDAYRGDVQWPLIVLLHGAGGTAQGGLRLIGSLADEHGLVLLAPASQGETWDVLYGGYGPDVRTIDAALGFVFDRYAIDPHRLAIGGFSDGASYALSLGLTNGNLFSHLIAFSPGFVAPETWHGTPAIFIAHGTRDEVLPIDACSRRIVPQLRRTGYQVTYHEFDGPHAVPARIVREALAWLRRTGTPDQTAVPGVD